MRKRLLMIATPWSERSTSACTARLVDIGSHKLSLNYKGKGSPTFAYLHGHLLLELPGGVLPDYATAP